MDGGEGGQKRRKREGRGMREKVAGEKRCQGKGGENEEMREWVEENEERREWVEEREGGGRR